MTNPSLDKKDGKECYHLLDIVGRFAKCLLCFHVWEKWEENGSKFIQRVR